MLSINNILKKSPFIPLVRMKIVSPKDDEVFFLIFKYITTQI